MVRQLVLLSGLLQIPNAAPENPFKIKELAATYDRATFCLGQLAAHEPALVSRLPCACEIVCGLASAVQHGWCVHHGVGKFAANALASLARAVDAEESVRATSARSLLSGLTMWLKDSTTKADPAGDVCGCHCETPCRSATCWLERLLGEPDELLEGVLLKCARFKPCTAGRT